MPGIVGLITNMPSEWAKPQVLRMVKSICHESFYNTGTWMDESAGVYVGWAAIKDSFSDAMPIRNERKDVTLIFSGEEFPDPEIRCQLRKRGHSVGENGPSYLVHVYEEEPAFPASLNGNFHGLLADRTHGTTTLFNDRFGMHRLYFHESKEAFYFAAEAKAILEVRPELREVDPRCMGEFVSCGCVLENRSLFKGIQVLPPASKWVFRKGTIDKKNLYFEPKEWEDQAPLEPEAYYQELRDVFTRNLPRYFVAQQPIGISLTGGLDTRMIMAWHKGSPGSLPCYTFQGTYRESEDVILGRKVAEMAEQPFQVIHVGEEFLSRFPSYAERSIYLTDSCVDVSRTPVLYSNERAAEIAPVRMTGNYGGEIIRSVRAFKPSNVTPGVFSSEFSSYIHATQDTYAGLIQTRPATFSAFRQTPWHHWGLHALEQTQLSPRSPFLDNDLVRTVYRSPEAATMKNNIFEDNDECLRLIADGSPALRALRTDRGLGAPPTLASAITRGLLEFTFKAEYAYDYGMPQRVAQIDHALSAFHLERLFLGRHKYYHFRVWYRDALSGYVKEMLLDPRTLSRPYLERKAIEPMVQGHLKGDRNYTTEIHKVLTLELMHRLFLDSN